LFVVDVLVECCLLGVYIIKIDVLINFLIIVLIIVIASYVLFVGE